MSLPPEVARELGQVAHHGSAIRVRALVSDAIIAIEADDHTAALEPLLEAKRAAPRSGAVRELLGLTYYHLERWKDAARELTTYRRLTDRDDQDHVWADCERALGRPDRALEILPDAAGAFDEEVLVERILVQAGALGDLERYDEAVIVLLSGPIDPGCVEPHHLRLWYVLGDMLEAAGRRREARTYWDAIYEDDAAFFDVAQRRLGVKSQR